MKFKINRDHFANGLQLVTSVVGARKTMQILQNVLIEASEGKVSLITTNLDLGVRCSVKADVSEPGSITLPVRELGSIVRQLAGMEVSVECPEGNRATISTRGSLFHIMGIDSKEFPPLPALDNLSQHDLSRDELTQMLRNVSYAQSVNEERYMLRGVYFSFAEGKLTMVATDGRRLAVTERALQIQEGSDGDFILPANTVSELEKLPSLGDTVKVSFNERQVAFEMRIPDDPNATDDEQSITGKGFVDSIYLVSKVVEGRYPNYRQVIPTETFEQSEVERELLQECILRAALVSDEKVSFSIKPGELEITGQSSLGDAKETMAIEYKGPEVTVSFNPIFFCDPLKALSKDKVTLEFRDEISPGIFRTGAGKQDDPITFLCVIMPIRSD
ncbi:MAG: DNA polymerase III subunit beta [Opitutae bacterium]|nr:DNA polymerase III subunit beta [Opitutae bacterium]|tara:strand:- start:10157 stop:11323 length:1167 start_codon:yes stop_codon:yes gene_type:complete